MKKKTNVADAGDEERRPRNGTVQHLVSQKFVLLRQTEALYDPTGKILQRFRCESRVKVLVRTVQSAIPNF